jgi:hypothetical protein
MDHVNVSNPLYVVISDLSPYFNYIYFLIILICGMLIIIKLPY